MIEFIKSLLLTPFVLHARPSFHHTKSVLESIPAESLDSVDKLLVQEISEAQPRNTNTERYAEIMLCIEELVLDHIYHQNNGIIALNSLEYIF